MLLWSLPLLLRVCSFVWCVEILADIHAEDARIGTFREAFHGFIDARVVESHAIDDRFGRLETKQPGLRIAGLGSRSQCADFYMPEAEGSKAIDTPTSQGAAPVVIAAQQGHVDCLRVRPGG